MRIREQREDIWGRAHTLSFHGVLLHAESRYQECIDKCREAIQLFERSGDYWELTTSRYEVALSLYRLGDLHGAIEEAQRTRQIGLDIGDRQASGMPLDVWVRASRGQVPAEILQSELNVEREDPQTESQLLLAEGVRLIYAGELQQAVATLEQANRVANSAGIRHAWVAAILPWLATARRMQLAAALADRSPQRRKLAKQARRATRRAHRLAKSFKNELPHVLREHGLLAALQGKHRRAKAFFDRSLSVAEAQDARYEQAQTLLERGKHGAEAGWPGAADDMQRAREMQRAIFGEDAA